MKNNRTLLVVMTVCMLAITVVSVLSGIYALSTHSLPLDMKYVSWANPTEVGVILIILAGLLITADLGLLSYLMGRKYRAVANIASFAAWVCALLVFVWGTTSVGAEWMLFFVLTLPPLITWIITGPSLEKAGDAW